LRIKRFETRKISCAIAQSRRRGPASRLALDPARPTGHDLEPISRRKPSTRRLSCGRKSSKQRRTWSRAT
jgi:hypothetical protein